MPFINVKISEKLSDEKMSAIKSSLGKAITLLPGKSESWLMVDIEDSQHLYFRGDNSRPSAFTDISIFGNASKENCEKLTAAVCEILEKEAGIPSDCSYVKFLFSDMWGYDGEMF